MSFLILSTLFAVQPAGESRDLACLWWTGAERYKVVILSGHVNDNIQVVRHAYWAEGKVSRKVFVGIVANLFC